jgi:hypothetical protein
VSCRCLVTDAVYVAVHGIMLETEEAAADAGRSRGRAKEMSMTKRIDVAAIAPVAGTLNPPPFDEPCRPRERWKLGDQAGPIWRQLAAPCFRRMIEPAALTHRIRRVCLCVSGEVVLVTDHCAEANEVIVELQM